MKLAQTLVAKEIYVVAGARAFSIGHAISEELASARPESAVLTIDVEPVQSSFPNIVNRQFDLNPLLHEAGFHQWSIELQQLLRLENLGLPRIPVKAVFLTLAKYNFGDFQEMSLQERSDMLGCNVLGKFEMLHAVMLHNRAQKFSNCEELDVVDFGSLHATDRTPHRALYNSTKAAGSMLCEVLAAGQEVRRALHVAPGRVDTPMLHWNHWFLKEDGWSEFPDLVRNGAPSLYQSIFCGCDRAALDRAVRLLNLDPTRISGTFERYARRRKMAEEAADGITSPKVLAKYLVGELLSDRGLCSGTLSVTSPQGQMIASHKPF
jgi:NAD(P)-dependent dehydrogenase (short-subunit alcohol dehydrogenase family)